MWTRIKYWMWKKQFNIVPVFRNDVELPGRCIDCDAGADAHGVECSKYRCPCSWDQQCKRRFTWWWIKF
jgi:hypothetical protein